MEDTDKNNFSDPAKPQRTHRRQCGCTPPARVTTASMLPWGSLVATYTSLSNVETTGAHGIKCRLGQLR